MNLARRRGGAKSSEEEQERLEIADDLLQEGGGFSKLPHFFLWKQFQSVRQCFHAALPSLPQYFFSFRSCSETDPAGVFRSGAADEFFTLEAGNDAAHCRGADLLGVGKFAEGSRAAKDQD